MSSRFAPFRAAGATALAGLAVLLFASAALAQSSLPRPKLAKDADERDWQAYLECARRPDVAREEEDLCLRWARRLDPERPEPAYVEWMNGRRRSPELLRAARVLDPFVHDARFVALESKPGPLTSPRRRAFGYLRAGDYLLASGEFARFIPTEPDDLEARWGAATAYHYRAKHDSAALQLSALAQAMQQRKPDRKAPYPPLDVVRWALAQSWLAAGAPDSASAVLEALLAAEPAFHQARALRGEALLARGDTAGAVAAYRAAVDQARRDVVTRARFGRLLSRVGQHAEAEQVLAAVVADAPDWAAPRRDLALALEAAGPSRRDAAIEAWEGYLAQAPAMPDETRKDAERRLAALRVTR